MYTELLSKNSQKFQKFCNDGALFIVSLLDPIAYTINVSPTKLQVRLSMAWKDNQTVIREGEEITVFCLTLLTAWFNGMDYLKHLLL